MGYDCDATGLLRFDPQREPDILAAMLAQGPPWWRQDQPETLLSLLEMCLGYEVRATRLGADGQYGYEVNYSATYSSDHADWLAWLGVAGVTGAVEFVGEDHVLFKHVITATGAERVFGEVYYPGDPEEGAGVVLLTSAQARAVLALVAGDQLGDLPEAVAALTAALET